MNRHASVRRWISLLVVTLSCGTAFSAPVPKPPVVQVVLCLDTSNSMDGLVDSAKRKLWDVVNDLAKAKPTPDLRVAVFSYGNNAYDSNAGWVRRELDFTTDLDRVSEKFFALQATKLAGSEEYVGRVCRDAVERLAWSDDAKALKVVFVCGNESADQDPEMKLNTVAENAVRKGITINTIFCGEATNTLAAGWREFARLSEGRFVAIDQSRGAVVIATPQDKELTELSAKLNDTFCFMGKDAKALAENQSRQDANALRLGGGVAAARADSKAGRLYRFEGLDLVERLQQDRAFDVKKVPAEDLPEALKKMTPPEREKHVQQLLAKREEIQKRVGELAKQRDAYIRNETLKNANAPGRVFDEAVRGVLRDQAKGKGIKIPD